MKYLRQVYLDESNLHAVPDSRMDMRGSRRKSGRHIAAEEPQPVHTATTAAGQERQGERTDGPLPARRCGPGSSSDFSDLNEVDRSLAAKIPPTRVGRRRPGCAGTFRVGDDRPFATAAANYQGGIDASAITAQGDHGL